MQPSLESAARPCCGDTLNVDVGFAAGLLSPFQARRENEKWVPVRQLCRVCLIVYATSGSSIFPDGIT